MQPKFYEQKSMGSARRFAVLLLLLVATLCHTALSHLAFCPAAFCQPTNYQRRETRYLLFQIFTYSGTESRGWAVFPPQGEVEATIRDITYKIGTRGDARHKLGVCLGPVTFNHSDDEVRNLIAEGFAIARRNDVAIAFHIDDQMFWDARSDLNTPENVEWSDWQRTLCQNRRLDWGEKPSKAPAQLCLNSPAVQAAVAARAKLIGSEIKNHLAHLKRDGKDVLFAGVITGWESMIGRDFATNHILGFHALSNLGYSAKQQPENMDDELANVVQEFIELWARNLVESGVPRPKIYCHIALRPPGPAPKGMTETQAEGFAPPAVAFGKLYRPGFSTYPASGSFEKIQQVLRLYGNPPFISAEGTNINPDGMPGERSMETYLGRLFNHGAVMVNIFSWGIGGERERGKNMFRRATESDAALMAYRKFLRSEPLIEEAGSATAFSPARFKEKIEKIQAALPPWAQRTGNVAKAQWMMQKLDGQIKAHEFQRADATADEILRMIK